MRKFFLALLSGAAMAVAFASSANALSCIPGTGSCGVFVSTNKTIFTVDVPVGGGYLGIIESTPFTIDVQTNPGDTLNNGDIIFQFNDSFAIHFISPIGDWTVALFVPAIDPPATVIFPFINDTNLPVTNISATPLPAALPLFATGLGALGWLAKRRKRKAAALAVA